MRIVFFGTPDFAVPSLQALVTERFSVVAVVTRPDRSRGRSRSVVVPSEVKTYAEHAGLPVLQPERPAGDLFFTSLRRLEPDLGVVVAYGHILRQDLLAIPRLGMINVHASLLPRYRGAAPIQHAILGGDRETGVTIMQMDAGLDTGPILHRVATPIEPDETAGELWQRLAALGSAALLEALSLIAGGLARPTPQQEALATYAPKIDRNAARIDWGGDATAIARQIRAFDPVPGAWTTLEGSAVKLFGARPADSHAHTNDHRTSVRSELHAVGHGDDLPISGQEPREIDSSPALIGESIAPDSDERPGTIMRVGERLLVACGRGALLIREVQPEGRNRLDVAAWARGRRLVPGQRLE